VYPPLLVAHCWIPEMCPSPYWLQLNGASDGQKTVPDVGSLRPLISIHPVSTIEQ
jgi:hypothetical protein